MSKQDHVHRWEVPAHHAAVVGPGSPLELVVEDVLGVPQTVLKNRPPHLRAVLQSALDRFADRDYLVFADGPTMTFADAGASIARMADWLVAEHGVQKGDCVAIAAANVPGYPIAWWATVSLGAVVSGLNGWWTPNELAYGIELTKPKVVLADDRRMQRLQEAGVDVPCVDFTDIDFLLGPAGGSDPALPTVDIDEDDPVSILFTSGTTGRPKGATLSHRNNLHLSLIHI